MQNSGKMKGAEVVLVPIPTMGHIVAVMEFAKSLVQRDDRLSATVLIMHPTVDLSTAKYAESIASSTLPNRIRVIDLPHIESITSEIAQGRDWITPSIRGHKRHVKEYVTNNIIGTQSEMSPSESHRLAGFVFDMFITGMNDVANEFGVPWYVFSASGAAFLGCLLDLVALHDEQGVDLTWFKNSDNVLEIRSLANPLPARHVPAMVFEKAWLPLVLEGGRNVRGAKGIFLNTFIEFEPHALNSLSADGKMPRLHPVGPILKPKGDGRDDIQSDESNNGYKEIMEWLDDQPVSSVMFLCFGSWGSFSDKQAKEIACALEQCGHRFLWSLRKPGPKDKTESPSDYVSFAEILPDGFLIRTGKTGKVIGWAPQVDILAHPAVGGFASHCGWNSILESVRYGVPIAAWPLYSEQQFNAFQMVIELGLAVEIKMDYRRDFRGDNEVIVSANDITRAIRRVMEQDGEIRRKIKEMSRISNKTLLPGGSSYSSMGRLTEDIIPNTITTNLCGTSPLASSFSLFYKRSRPFLNNLL